MSNDKPSEFFADGIINVSHANGVFRITFGQQEAEGEVSAVLKLMIPASQMAPTMQSLSAAINDIAGKIRDKGEGTAEAKPKAKPKMKTQSRSKTKSS